MSHPKEDLGLTPPAARLARAAPNEWKEFVIAFRKYADQQRDYCVQATLDELQRTQGRAQATGVIATLLDDAVTAADRMSARQK